MQFATVCSCSCTQTLLASQAQTSKELLNQLSLSVPPPNLIYSPPAGKCYKCGPKIRRGRRACILSTDNFIRNLNLTEYDFDIFYDIQDNIHSEHSHRQDWQTFRFYSHTYLIWSHNLLKIQCFKIIIILQEFLWH